MVLRVCAEFYGLKKSKKSGWIHENGGERFYLGDSGQYVANNWYKDGDKWYWFDGNGHMVADVWYQYKGSWYYLSQDGSMAKGLQAVDGKWYYLDQDGRMATDPVLLVPDKDGALQWPGMAE